MKIHKIFETLMKNGFSDDEVQKVLSRVDGEGFPPEDIKQGMNVEVEHADVTRNAEDILKITLAHLKEDPDYYRKLKKYVEK